jgi:hypothetical protein
MEPGIYIGMKDRDYRAIPALSNSGIGDLLVQPLTYWDRHFNPDPPPPRETTATVKGSATHCRILQPELYPERYATALRKEDVPGALVTMDDLKDFCEANGLPKTAKRKEDLIERIKLANLTPPIWEEEVRRHAFDNQGKTFLTQEEGNDVESAAAVVIEDAVLSASLSEGYAEVVFVVRDPETGVLLKSMQDYVAPSHTTDVKTMTVPRNKSFERAVYDSLYYEDYLRQGVFNTRVRAEARRQLAAGEIDIVGDVTPEWREGFLRCLQPGFDFIFVESSRPFNVRLEELSEYDYGTQQSVYWMSAESKIHNAIHLFEQCLSRFGEMPWRAPAERHRLHDSDIPQISFSR